MAVGPAIKTGFALSLATPFPSRDVLVIQLFNCGVKLLLGGFLRWFLVSFCWENSFPCLSASKEAPVFFVVKLRVKGNAQAGSELSQFLQRDVQATSVSCGCWCVLFEQGPVDRAGQLDFTGGLH